MDEQSYGRKKIRSSSYPSFNLEQAIKNAEMVKKNLGRGPFSRDLAAKSLGYRGISGRSGMAISTLVQYGLLSRKANTYGMSSLSNKLFAYRDENERRAAIIEAASSPRLYKQLIEAYAGRSLPAMLSHILTRDYGISEAVASNVAATFEASMSFAGLMEDGVLSSVRLSQENPAPLPSVHNDYEDADNDSAPGAVTLPSRTDVHVQSVNIIDGVDLYYRADLAFKLFTSPEFSSALQSLKTALDTNEKDAKQQN